MENVHIKTDPIVTAIFDALATGEKCLCELKELAGVPQTWDLYDLRMLEDHKAIQSRSANGYRYYSLTPSRALWYLRKIEARTEQGAYRIRPPVHYDTAIEYARRAMPRMAEYEAVLRRGV